MIDQALYKQGLVNQMRRKRFGSLPILHLPSIDEADSVPVIRIVRSGNTAPETLIRLVKGFFPNVEVEHVEEKHGIPRVEYSSPHTDPRAIVMDLLRATRDVTPTDLQVHDHEM
jgi:hypothetical protein